MSRSCVIIINIIIIIWYSSSDNKVGLERYGKVKHITTCKFVIEKVALVRGSSEARIKPSIQTVIHIATSQRRQCDSKTLVLLDYCTDDAAV